jgi:hypothetical protein
MELGHKIRISGLLNMAPFFRSIQVIQKWFRGVLLLSAVSDHCTNKASYQLTRLAQK